MLPSLFDSSVYISWLRRPDHASPALRKLAADSSLWLSAVVLEELYAGARDRDRDTVEQMERAFDRAQRILVPSLRDWAQTGKVLARLAAKYDYESIGRARLTNDALLAMSAGRLGITVFTANLRDFSRLAEFSAFHWQLATV